MPSVTAGRSIPQMIQVRYQVGLADAANEYPDVIDLIYKMATLSIVQDTFPDSSFSQSIDGMIQSSSVDLSKMGEYIDSKIETLRQYFQGITAMVL